jgi:pimeloyl-ACP methyl ester carboxylesterase
MNANKGDYAEVNGLRMYYEVHGEGRPLVVLHGAYMTVDVMGSILPGLAETRRVIVPEMQGHGRTADIDRPITYEGMADDVAALIRHLGLDRPDAFGYSMGGGVALQLAIRHPGSVRRLVVASASYTSDGMQPELHEMIPTITPEMFSGSPMEASYQEVAPNPEDFPVLVEKLKDLDMTPFDWGAENVRGIGAPTMIVVGDADVVRLEHAVEMFRLLGGGAMGDLSGLPDSQLLVLPGTAHFVPPGNGVLDRAGWLVPMMAVPGRTRGGGGAVGGGRAVRRVPDVAEPARGGGTQVPGTSPLRQLGTPARITTGRRPFCQSDSPCGSRR